MKNEYIVWLIDVSKSFLGMILNTLSFVDDSSILSGILVAALVSIIIRQFIFSPRFKLKIWNEKQNEIHLLIYSQRKFSGYEYGTVFYTVYFPKDVFQNFVVQAHNLG